MKSLITTLKVLFVLLVASTASFAQTTITVGTATGATSGTTAGPISIYYESMHFQVIYSAAELSAAGLTSGMAITELGWDVVNIPTFTGGVTPQALPDYAIKMGHTLNTTSTTTNPIPSTSLMAVYSNPSYLPTLGYDMLSLGTPFSWNGVDNIVLDICWTPVADWEQAGFVSTYTAPQQAHYFRADGIDQCGLTTGNSGNLPDKPVVQFTTIPGPSCASVNGLMAMNATSTSVDIAFNHTGTPLSYIVEYGAPGFAMGTGRKSRKLEHA